MIIMLKVQEDQSNRP